MDRDPVNVLSLCSGYGGLDLGLAAGLDACTGRAARVVCHVEREAFPAAILAYRMAEEGVDQAPVWSDLRTFDGRRWRGCVDCITGGYPCQPFSFAGERKGEADPRHLWPEVARIVEEVEPGLVFFENVGGHLSLGFDAVAGDLHRMGFRVAAGLFSAAEVGASHRRERLFILGVADGECERGKRRRIARELGSEESPEPCEAHERQRDGYAADGGDGDVAEPIGERGRGGYQRCDAADVDASGGAALAHARISPQDARPESVRTRDDTDREPSGVAGFFPPGPGVRGEWARILRFDSDLAPAITRTAESEIRRMADGGAARLDRLRALGNGVVPLAAAYAFCTLWACLEE